MTKSTMASYEGSRQVIATFEAWTTSASRLGLRVGLFWLRGTATTILGLGRKPYCLVHHNAREGHDIEDSIVFYW